MPSPASVRASPRTRWGAGPPPRGTRGRRRGSSSGSADLGEGREATQVAEHGGPARGGDRPAAAHPRAWTPGRRPAATGTGISSGPLAFDRREQAGVVVAQALLGERRGDAGPEQRRLDRPRQVVRGAHLDAADDPVEVVQPETTITGILASSGLARIAASTAKPSSSGMTRSSSTTSIPAPSSPSRSSATRPSSASTTS